jgi:hypothetical protein
MCAHTTGESSNAKRLNSKKTKEKENEWLASAPFDSPRFTSGKLNQLVTK